MTLPPRVKGCGFGKRPFNIGSSRLEFLAQADFTGSKKDGFVWQVGASLPNPAIGDVVKDTSILVQYGTAGLEITGTAKAELNLQGVTMTEVAPSLAMDVAWRRHGNRTCELPCTMQVNSQCRRAGGYPCIFPFRFGHSLHYCVECQLYDDDEAGAGGRRKATSSRGSSSNSSCSNQTTLSPRVKNCGFGKQPFIIGSSRPEVLAQADFTGSKKDGFVR